jgi:hypothetical protein
LDALGLRSPDRADAVIGAFAHGNPNYLTYARMPNPWEAMDEVGDPQEALHDRSMQQKLGAWCGE